MKVSKKTSKIKGYRAKKHEFEIESASMAGYHFVTLKKNGNPILKCSPEEFQKFKKFICS